MDSLLGHNSKKCFPLRGVSNSGQNEESLGPPLSFCKFSLLSLFPSPSIPLSLSSLSRLLPSAHRSLDSSADQVVCPNDGGYIPRSNQIVSKHGSRATDHIAHLSTSSTTICFLTYFISVCWFWLSWTRAMMKTAVSWGRRYGPGNADGTSPCKFVRGW